MSQKYIHIMYNEKFISAYIEFINKNFNMNKHKFLVIDGDKKFDKYNIFAQNVEYKKTINKRSKIIKLLNIYIYLIKELKNSKKIYFHSLFDKKVIFFLFLFRKYLKKSNWIIWGGDLYCYEKRKKDLKYKIWYYIEDYVKRNIGYVSTLVPEDYEIAKKYYKVNGKYQKALYPFNNDFKYIESLIVRPKDEVYIQIGNSADSSNNHFEIIDLLSKFKGEKIRIYAILSYGDSIYAQKVNTYGKEIFGDKFIGIFDFMSIDKYWSYIKDIDILIFNHNRQQGLGNITMLSYFEKKVYIRKDISSWNYLTKDIELKLNSVDEIKKQTFQEFINNNAKGNKEKILVTILSNEYGKKIWEENFGN